jgi:pimeloyl-ACP methyl ester carboxylesterase
MDELKNERFDADGTRPCGPCRPRRQDADAARPAIVFLHGALNDHTVWSAHSRAFAASGWNVLAPDLPGHGRSGGAALGSVEALADWLIALLDAAGVRGPCWPVTAWARWSRWKRPAAIPERAGGLALLGCTWPMKVSDALLEAARDDEAAAIDMVARWSHTDAAAQEGTQQLMLDLAARSAGRQLLYTDLAACNAYAGGLEAAARVRCPVLFVTGSRDKMTPPRSLSALAAALDDGRIVSVDAGHAMMAEQGAAVQDALAGFAGAAA